MSGHEVDPAQTDQAVDKLALAALFLLLTRQNQQLRHDATHDQLTGLLNRRGLEELLARNTPPRAMLYVDGTNQKAVNDNISHDRGDEAIIGTADILKSCLRPGDIAARLGGDEFIVLVDTERRLGGEHLEPEEVLDPVMSRIYEATQGFLESNPDLQEVGFDIAIGGSVWQEDMSIEDLRSASEQAMYKNKDGQHETNGQHR